MHHPRLIEPGRTQRQVERGGDVAGLHRSAELPGHDVAREVVEHGRQVVPHASWDYWKFRVGAAG